MHKLFEQVLEKKDLSKAGDLFSLEDSVIVDELSEVLKTIQVGHLKTIRLAFQFRISAGNFQQARVSDESQQPEPGGDLCDEGDLRHPGDWLHPASCGRPHLLAPVLFVAQSPPLGPGGSAPCQDGL